MSEPKRIVCYAINGSGLGHVTRLIAVGRWLRRFVALLDHRVPEVIFLTSSDASDALSRAGFASFKIPSKTVARKAELDKLEYRRLAKHFVWNTLGVFAPDLLVVDTFPSGSFDELFQVLDGPFKKGFIYRRVKPEYAARPTFRSALGLYDTVVVPHRREPSPAEATGIDATFCGEVIQFEREEMLPRSFAREQLGVASEHRLVYVSAGGGGDPDAESVLRSLVNTLKDQDDIHLLVGAGPLYRGQRLAGPRVTWFDAPGIFQYFAAVDAAICAAGYNTFHEVLYAGVPTAFFAQFKIADDQGHRISDAIQAGACRQIADITDPVSIRDHLRELLDPATADAMRTACGNVMSNNGARQCALELLRPLYEPSLLAWASRLLSPRLVHALESIGNGTTSVLPDWLTPLMPRGQIESIASHPGFDGVLNRLSPAAAQEVEQVLADRDEALSESMFEAKLIELLNMVRDNGARPGHGSDVVGFGDDVLRTMVATMKKQPLAVARNGNRTRWVCSIIEQVHALTKFDVGIPTLDVLRLFRMFPRVVDVDADETFPLFEKFLQHRRSLGEPTHEIMHRLQVLKVSNPRVSRTMLDTISAGATP